MIKGLIYSLSLILSIFLIVALLEYIGKFNSTTRMVLFFSTIIAFLGIIFYYIISPLLKLNNLGSRINYEKAAAIIGTHFNNVQDKLLNTLQLINNKNQNQDLSLVYASIDQRISELNPIPFTSAIDFNENKKYLRFLIIPVLAFAIIYLFNASIINDSTQRIVNYQSTFIPQAPFSFNITNESLSVIQNNDFTIDLSIKGEQLPEDATIIFDEKEYKLNKTTKNDFNYTFSNVQKNKVFYFEAAGFKSQEYELKTIQSPLVSSFKTIIDYPSHTGLIDETIENIGDLNVPQGTKVKWVFNTKNTNNIKLAFADTNISIDKENQNLYSYSKTIAKDETYLILSSNDQIKNKEVSRYFIQVKGDEFPQISVNQKNDSTNQKLIFFQGAISDDYGFSNLVFNYRIIKKDSLGNDQPDKFISLPIAFNKNFNRDNFLHFFDFSTIGLQLGEKVEYFFQVWDNDVINGYKSAKSKTSFIKAPTKEELEESLENKNADIKKDLKETVKDAEKLKEDINKLKEEILSKKNLDWKDKKKIDNILNQQKELQKQIDQINNQNQQKNQQKEEFNKQQSEDLKNKEEQLQDMMNELQSPEMEELFKKLEKLSEKLDKNQLQETLEKIDMENIDLKKELERSLEMFKQMEMDEKLDELSKELEKLAEKQEELAKNDSLSKKEKEEKQEEINKEFDDLGKDMEELKEKNEELQNKKDLDDMNSKEEEIKKDLQNSLDQLQKQQDAKQQQQGASDKMKQMAHEMQSMMSMNNKEQQQENMEDLRALLENLITLSFDQEDVMNQLKVTGTNDPKYVKLGQQQNKLKDDAKMIEDSLFALSLRVEQIQSIVNKEINDININIKNAIGNIEKRQTANATVNQQLTMTAINNLALLLDEALKQMQQQMAQQNPGSGSCNNPGGASPKPSLIPSMKEAQQGVSESLKKLREQMGKEKGKSPSKEGENGSGGQSAKELARMAAEQAALREAVKQMSEQLNKDGSGSGNGLKKIEKEMEKVEEDIINNQITQETIKRQQEILTRLLESEKAIREREFDKERESKSVKNSKISNPEQFLEYKKQKEKELELLKTISPELVPYYKNKVNEYFNKTYE